MISLHMHHRAQHNSRTKGWQWRMALALGVSVLGLAGGCPAPRHAGVDASLQVVLVVPRQTNAVTGAFLKLAREAFPQADLYSDPARLSKSSRRYVLLVLQASQLDPIQWPALAQSLNAGTPVLFWGLNPLQRLADDPPDLPLVSPSFRRFASPAVRMHWLGGGATLPLTDEVQSPFPRSASAGDATRPATRWIPLVETEDASGAARAWPASLWVEAPTNAPLRSWGWVGVDIPGQRSDVVVSLLRACAQRLQDGCYLIQAGADRVAFESASRLDVGIRVVQRGGAHELMRVNAELVEENDRSTRRVSAAAQDEVRLTLGALPRLTTRIRDYTLRLTLESADEQQVLDQITQSVRVLPDGEQPPVDRVGIIGSGFTLGRRPLFLFGATFALANGLGQSLQEPVYQPLDPEAFDTEAVKRAIAQAQEAGLNLLDLTLEEERQIPQLRWLLEQLRPRSMWVQLHVAGLDPLALDLPRARHLLEAAHVLNDPVVVALEAGSVPTLGPEEQRRGLDADWRAWLAEQYGSVDQAERALGRALWRHEGEITGPPDTELAGVGDAAAPVAVYRRFVDDYLSRRLGMVRRMLDDAGCRVLLSARRGWGGPPEQFPLDPISGAIHLDFITLDATGLDTDDVARAAASFSTLYARGMTLGKPVVWRNVGLNVGRQAGPAELARQAERVQELMSMALNSHAAGLLVPRLPGGWSPREQKDEGFTFPDGRWRPAGDLLRRFTLRVRREASAPHSWTGLTCQRDDDPRGLYGWLLTRSAEDHPAEIRPAGFGIASWDAASLAVGGAPHQDPAPWSLLNAEWGALRTESQRVERVIGAVPTVAVRAELELDLWNTGPARWVNANAHRTGAVWVRATRPEAREQWLTVPETPSGQRAVVRWIPTDPGVWELRAWSSGQGGFGEPLRVDVQ